MKGDVGRGCKGVSNRMSIEVEAPMVEAVIVTWNKRDDVIQLLEQLKHIDYPVEKLEITVVDNDSTDGTIQEIETFYPSVNLIKNRENLGGAGGFNAGMRWVLENRPACEYMWLLDNDVLVDKGALRELVAVMNSNPEAGICGSKIMNIENPPEIIELGAFIDYIFGDIRRNIPDCIELKDPQAVFEVDYVAGCSLIARNEYVKRLGVWREHFFIYWDDMEWGARFNAFGYKVLACNSSIVYHPSWAGRCADNSAIWRCYYRTRNSLWFFNNYCTGVRRRLLLAHMIIRSAMHAASTCLAAYSTLSRAFLMGVEDFLKGRHGKKEFRLPADNLTKYLDGTKSKDMCVFVLEDGTAESATRFVCDLIKEYPGMKVLSIVPKASRSQWESFRDKGDIVTYERSGNGSIPWPEKLRIMRFLRNRPWSVLLTSPLTPRIGAIWGKDVARVDFKKGSTIAIERMSLKDLLCIPLSALSYLSRIIFSPPERDAGWVEKVQGNTGCDDNDSV